MSPPDKRSFLYARRMRDEPNALASHPRKRIRRTRRSRDLNSKSKDTAQSGGVREWYPKSKTINALAMHATQQALLEKKSEIAPVHQFLGVRTHQQQCLPCAFFIPEFVRPR